MNYSSMDTLQACRSQRIRTNWSSFPPGTECQTVIVTKRQISSGTMSMPLGRCAKVFGDLLVKSVHSFTIWNEKCTQWFEISVKQYHSQPSQVFLHGLTECFSALGVRPWDALCFVPTDLPGSCKMLTWSSDHEKYREFVASLDYGWSSHIKTESLMGKDTRSNNTAGAVEESWVQETLSSKGNRVLEPGKSVSVGSYRSVCVSGLQGGKKNGLHSSLQRNDTLQSGIKDTSGLSTARLQHKKSRARVGAESTGESPPPYKKSGHTRCNSEGITMNVLSSSSMLNRSSSGLGNGSQLENKQVSGSMDTASTKQKRKKISGFGDKQTTTASVSSRRKKSVPLRGAQVVSRGECNCCIFPPLLFCLLSACNWSVWTI